MTDNTWFGFMPSQEQRGALDDLVERLIQRTVAIAEAARADPVPTRESRNVLACLGPRGAGKSTLLAQLAPQVAEADNGTCRKLREAGVHVASLVDCSALPQEVAPGVAILVEILEDERLWRDLPESAQHKLKDELRHLTDRFATVDPSYRELCVELSTTPSDFPQLITEGVRTRLRLQRDLSRWLEQACARLKVQSIVLLLDDFDLVPGRQVRAWLQTMLDAFHQWRLLFVLGADAHRLQHLSFDPKAEMDDVTARALVQKVLPESNQVHLTPFGPETRTEFRPRKAKSQPLRALLADGLLDRLKPYESEVIALLPQLPRGLLSFYEALESWIQGRRKGRLPGVERFLAVLASSRGELLLARRLEDVQASAWVEELRWGRRPASNESWRESVRAAGKDSGGASLPGLDLPLVRPRRGLRQDPLEHNPTWSDPLRHDQLIRDQLRDAQPSDRARWVELLLDLSLGSAVHRSLFLRAWGAMHERVEHARLRLIVTPEQLWSFYTTSPFGVGAGSPALGIRPLLPWLAFVQEQRDGAWIVDVGWTPLLSVLRGEGDPWPAHVLARLLVAPDDVSGELATEDPEHGLRVLPGRVRPLVLLVDALARCPWRAFAAPTLGWSLLTYVRLAGAFVRTAYLEALSAAGLLSADVGPAQRVFSDQLKHADPYLRRAAGSGGAQAGEAAVVVGGERQAGLNRLEEDSICELLDDLAKEDPLLLVPEGDGDELCRAARDFFNSPAYRALGLTTAADGIGAAVP